jgi:uncharacterized glyoxalase superfamily protein PhnB
VAPYVLYRDPAAAAGWVAEVLGFDEAIRFTVPGGGSVGHLELERDGAVIILGLAGSRFGETSSITLVYVEDVVKACARAVAAGGTVLDEPADQSWGLRQAVVADPESQRWELSQHLRDVDPLTGVRSNAIRRPGSFPSTLLPSFFLWRRHATPCGSPSNLVCDPTARPTRTTSVRHTE